MRSMVLLIDANVLFDFVMHRQSGYAEAKKVLDFCRTEKVKGYMAFHTVSILWYVLRKKPDLERRQLILDLCKIVTVHGAPHDAVVAAIENDKFMDFEDCLQEKCAEAVKADYIVTGNTKDYTASSIPFITPFQILEILEVMA